MPTDQYYTTYNYKRLVKKRHIAELTYKATGKKLSYYAEL